MRSVFILVALCLLAQPASAQSNTQPPPHKKCWAQTDPRGYGFWDECGEPKEVMEQNRHKGIYMDIPTARSGNSDNSSVGNGGGGGGGGSGK